MSSATIWGALLLGFLLLFLIVLGVQSGRRAQDGHVRVFSVEGHCTALPREGPQSESEIREMFNLPVGAVVTTIPSTDCNPTLIGFRVTSSTCIEVAASAARCVYDARQPSSLNDDIDCEGLPAGSAAGNLVRSTQIVVLWECGD